MKLVINACFGGFGISEKAYKRYAELKGLTLYPELIMGGLLTYWTIPKKDRMPAIKPELWLSTPLEERQAYNEFCRINQIYDRDLSRSDDILVKVVEELGSEANTPYSDLKIIEIPDGIEYEIDEYDGFESVHEKHRSWS